MKKTLLLLLALLVACCVMFSGVDASMHSNNSTHVRMRNQELALSQHVKRSYYNQALYAGKFNRDVYVAAMFANDVYASVTVAMFQDLTPEYKLIKRVAIGNYVFNAYASETERKIVFSFRGTEFFSLSDWEENLDRELETRFISQYTSVGIHKGFLNEILFYQEDVNLLLDSYPDYSIIWTGHSQGGGLAQIAACLFGFQHSYPYSRAKLITFGSTAAGDQRFAQFAATIVQHHRIVNAEPCTFLNCFDVDWVSDILDEPYTHFGIFYPLETDYTIFWVRHSMDNYLKQVALRLNPNDLMVFKVKTESPIIYQQISRVYYFVEQINKCLPQTLVLKLTKDTSTWTYSIGCSQSGYLDISIFQPGTYSMSASLGGYVVQTFPTKLTILAPPFECPTTCSGDCDYNRKQCTTCINGFYGPLCQYYCNPNCLSCNSSSSCIACKNSNTNLPACAARCNGCINGQCIEGKCVCKTGWTGVNCTTVSCPENCLTCSSPFLCTSCLPRTFGATCSFTCIPNCLQCSDDKTCSKCDAGFSGSSCSVGPNSFSTKVNHFLQDKLVSLPKVPFKIRTVVSNHAFNYFGIGNRFDLIFRYSFTDTLVTSVSVLFENSTYAPFSSISSFSESSITTTSVPGHILVYGNHPSVPVSPTILLNTRVNETFINVQQTSFFSYFLTSSGNVRVYGDSSKAGSTCSASGFYGVYKISNYSIFDIPVKISYLSCPMDALCFAYSRETKRLFGWGLVLSNYYGGTALCQYTPLELDTSFFGSETIMSINGWGPVFFLTESGKVYYIGSSDYLARPSKPTLLNSNFIGTNAKIIKVTVTYSSIIFTSNTMNNYVVGLFFKVSNGATGPSTTGQIWNTETLVSNYLTYSTIYCNGRYDFDPTVCSGNGQCEEIDMCYCNTGFSGSNCEIPVCFGKRADVSNVCSGVGSCFTPNNCSCPPGYSGLNCEVSITTNCLPSTSDCRSCRAGFFDTSSLCKSRCMVNCEKCSSSETCEKCVEGTSGPYCNEKQCQAPNCLSCSTKTGLCLECNEGLYGDICNSTCPFNCLSCSSASVCSSCKTGWYGQSCGIPYCQDNCLQCSSPTQCTKCVDGYFGPNCTSTCLSTCQTCTNASSCLTCPPFSSGANCELEEESCFSISSSPRVSVSNPLATSSLIYTITIPNSIVKSVNYTRFGFSNIFACNNTSNELVLNTTRKYSCETEFTLITSVQELLKDSRIQQQLDVSGVVLTMTVPIYIGLISNVNDHCQITNYQVNHQIKLLLSSHQFINMGVLNANSTVQLSYRRDVLAINNKKLTILGTLLSGSSVIEGVTYIQSEPLHNVTFDINLKISSPGVYSLSISAREVVNYFSGTFSFNVYLRNSNEVFQIPLVISLSYYMPIDPPSSEFKLYSQLSLYSENFKEVKNSFQLNEKPHIVVKLVDSEGKSSALQTTVRISLNNAYMCCVKSGQPMPPFDLQNGKYGCTQYNPSLMINWFQLIRNQTDISQYESAVIRFPFVNNQIGLNFKLTSQMFANTTFGSVSNCFIHTETILKNEGQSARRSLQSSSSNIEESYNSYDIIQIVNNNQQPIDPSTPALNSPNVLSYSSIAKASYTVLCSLLLLFLISLV